MYKLEEQLANRICKVVAMFLLLLVFVFVTVDTRMFVYPSLSRSLIPELLVLLLMALAFVCCITKKQSFLHSKMNWFIFAWVAYITIHYACVYPHEQYKTVYLLVSLLFIPIVSVLLNSRFINRAQCENIIILTVLIHIIFVFMQWLGLIGSGNRYFNLTGSNENPTVTAIYIVGCIPVIVEKLYRGNNKKMYSFILLVCIVVIIALQCRTAYIGLSIELFVAIVMIINKRHYHIPQLYRYPFMLVMMLTVISIGMRCYDMKRGSADGRILIWNISAKMIIEKPQGYGYGLFEKYYNLRQAEYFANGNGTEKEKLLADYVFMPYNDFLEHGVEGGVIGLCFLVLFYGIIISLAKRRHDVICLSVFVAFAVMSLTNFIYSSIQSWLLLMLLATFTTSDNSIKEGVSIKEKVFQITLITVIFLSCNHVLIRMTTGQIKLAEYKERIMKRETVSDDEFASIKKIVGTSEAYWTLRAYNNMLLNRFSESATDIFKSLNYTSSSQSLEKLYQMYELSGSDEKGIKYIEKLRYMIPNLLRPKLILMQYYDSHGSVDKAICYAREIVSCQVKIENEMSRQIRSTAYDYIISHQ